MATRAFGLRVNDYSSNYYK